MTPQEFEDCVNEKLAELADTERNRRKYQKIRELNDLNCEIRQRQQEVREAIDISESTLYPVLRRLQKDECLEVYDMEYGGRNRRYYKVTSKGNAQLALYRSEWRRYSGKISAILKEV